MFKVWKCLKEETALLYLTLSRMLNCVCVYSQCLGMLPENVGELLQKEESLQIDHLTEEPNPTQYKNMSNVNDSSGHTHITGSPRSPSTPQFSVDSKVSMSSWMQVLMSAENGSVTYSDDYCTLSHALSEHAVNTHKH